MGDNLDSRKAWWQIFLESSGGTALITVFIGGIAGSIITASMQIRTKEKEFKNSLLNSYNTTQIEYSKNFLIKQEEATKDALNLVSKTLNACQNLVDSKSPDLNTYNNQDQVEKLRNEFNNGSDHWEEKKYSTGFLLAHYHNSSLVSINWKAIIDKCDELIACSSSFQPSTADSDLAKKQTEQACSDVQADLIENIDLLLNKLHEKAGKEWAGFKSYEELKLHLGL